MATPKSTSVHNDNVPQPNAAGCATARLDRLPLTWVQWRRALITQIFWGVIIAADRWGRGVRPRPEHAD